MPSIALAKAPGGSPVEQRTALMLYAVPNDNFRMHHQIKELELAGI